MDRLDEIIRVYSSIRAEHIEEMAAAYLLHTDIDPREVELVEVREDNRIRWYFQKRSVSAQEHSFDNQSTLRIL